MPWSKSIRSRFLLSTTGVIVAAIGTGALVAARMLGSAAEESVRRDIERTAGLVARAGFPRSNAVFERLKGFLGADIATLDPGGRAIDSTIAGVRLGELERLLRARGGHRGAPYPDEERVFETILSGTPVTIGWAPFEGGALALVFPGRHLSERRLFTLVRLGGVALAGAALAAAGGLVAARSVARPIEDLARAAGRIAAGDLETRLEAKTGDEIEALARALATMVKSLRDAERLAALGRLTAALAHELKNPLTSIGMALEVEKERLPEGRSREALGVVLREVRKLSLFAGRLLAFARGPAVSPRPAALAAVAAEVLSLLAPQIEHLGIRVACDFPDDLPPVLLDPDAFSQVVLNLVKNAIEAMPRGGALAVSARAGPAGVVRLEVSDVGPGVPPEDAPRLFEPFFTTKETGTGLGLAIARAIVEAHGGAIRYRPRAPHGAVFEVEIPAASGTLPLLGGERVGMRREQSEEDG
jgi:signal transduction histidine kinase